MKIISCSDYRLTMHPIFIYTWTRLVCIVRRLLAGLGWGIMSDPNRETRQLGFRWCKDSIGGAWGKFTEEDLVIRKLSGGLTNYLYLCSLPDTVESESDEPRTVLLRIYGHIAKTSKDFVVHNSVIFALLSEKGLGPKLYGIYPEGRIEEYIPTGPLTTTDLHKPEMSKLVARKLAHFHSLDMPLCKEPRWLKNMLTDWLKEVMNNLSQTGKTKDQLVQKLLSFKLEEELTVLLEILSEVPSPVVFSHNDLQEGNLLYLESCPDPNRRLTVIDWEYCSYNYRGFDFGNHFIEWCYDYSVPDYPCFSCHTDAYPSRSQQYDFFKEYLNASKKPITDQVLEEMFLEANTFVLASHFFWGLWSVIQTKISEINFGYMEYAVSRFEVYFQMKESLPALLISDVTESIPHSGS